MSDPLYEDLTGDRAHWPALIVGAIDELSDSWPWMKQLLAGGAYDRLQLMNKAACLDFVLEVIRRRDEVAGFEAQSRR